ncbi:MAG: hypothetical protein AAF745_07600, partial [Planctomycetota bacterium]
MDHPSQAIEQLCVRVDDSPAESHGRAVGGPDSLHRGEQLARRDCSSHLVDGSVTAELDVLDVMVKPPHQPGVRIRVLDRLHDTLF